MAIDDGLSIPIAVCLNEIKVEFEHFFFDKIQIKIHTFLNKIFEFSDQFHGAWHFPNIQYEIENIRKDHDTTRESSSIFCYGIGLE